MSARRSTRGMVPLVMAAVDIAAEQPGGAFAAGERETVVTYLRAEAAEWRVKAGQPDSHVEYRRRTSLIAQEIGRLANVIERGGHLKPAAP